MTPERKRLTRTNRDITIYPMQTTIGNNILRVREALGVTQSALGRQCRTSQSAISQIEAGQRNPSFGMLLKIKRSLGVNWTSLLRGIE